MWRRPLVKTREAYRAAGVPRSFFSVAVMATSCREIGLTIVALEGGDFRRPASVEIDFRRAGAWAGEVDPECVR
jgi:hypothetical protein